ncbi:MAG: GAF domain-containing protein [Verrucomicrobia bacterium]|jgi:GAF domain-containing protein|nr:GAF domain-containing protein [Verrucomicrobiota bacterium]
MSHPIPSNESQRLKVLWQYEVLDTVPEAMFDDLTELAASICDVPIALVSLVDEDRQWFKSTHGVSLRETSRDISFCAHAICRSGLFIVPDARKDVRFKNNPLVTGGPKIRFYAGSPLVTPDGYALGTLCVLDPKPRRLNTSQQRAMQLLARVTVSLLELRRRANVPVTVGKVPRCGPSGRSTARPRKPRARRSRRS